MTDLLGPAGPAADDPTADNDPAVDPDEGRITEIGPRESVDSSEHPTATAVGIVALLLVAVIALVGLSGLMTPETEEGRQVAEIVVPRMGGRPLPEAQAALERLGLIVDVRYEPNEVVPVDVVVDQEPIAGARLEVGEQVILVVSDGPAGVRVPDLVDVTAAEATRLLGALGLAAIIEEIFDEQVPQGAIVGTIPALGARVVPGAEVTILLSRGPEPRTMPEVVGRPSTEAFAAIGRAELQVGRVTRRASGDAAPGTVLSTEPAPGTQAARGFPVDVVIAAAPGIVTVPDLVGFNRTSASSIADDLGLDVSVRTEVVTAGDRRNGRVISQGPVANTPVPPGSTVTITVGAVPTPTTTTTTTTPSGSTTTTPDD